MFKNILIAVDGSEHARRAAHTAGELARSQGAEIWLVIAYDPLPGFIGQPMLQEMINRRMDQANEVLELAQVALGEAPAGLHKEVLEGPPAEAILAVAKTRQVDLIVMGTRGLGRLASLLIGSQSQKVIAHAACPVLIVH